MSDQLNRTDPDDASLRDRLQALLDEGLDEAELLYRVRLLLPTEDDDAAGIPTTDSATEHPGYQ